MDKPLLVSAEDMKTIENYTCLLSLGLIGIRSLELTHAKALSLGILDENESEMAAALLLELKHLSGLYINQIENVTQRTSLDEKEVLNQINNYVYGKKRKTTKKA